MNEQDIEKIKQEILEDVLNYVINTESELFSKTLINSRIQNPEVFLGRFNRPDIEYKELSHNFSGSSGTWVVSSTEKNSLIIYVSGAGGGAEIILPIPLNGTRLYYIVNSSLNSITAKAPDQTGVVIASSSEKLLYFNRNDGDYKSIITS